VSELSTGEHPLLLEIGTEELPAGVIEPAQSALSEGFRKLAADLGLSHGRIRGFSTPRRLAILVESLSARQPDRTEEVLGPPLSAALDAEGRYTNVGLGFAQKVGLRPEELLTRPGKRGEHLAATLHRAGRPAADVLAEGLPGLIASLPFHKTMRWESSGFRFSRPIRWLVALLGGEVIPFRVADVTAGRESRGHRFLSEGRFELRDASDYEEALRERFVVADASRRREQIGESLLSVLDGPYRVVPDEELLGVVTNLLEWPLALTDSFEEYYLELPREVLVTVLRHHQKIFAVEDTAGKITNRFVVILGTRPNDLKQSLKGYARVIRARLEDAHYFYRQDRKRPLAERVDDLGRMLYLKGLGTVLARTQRLRQAVAALADRLAPHLSAQATRAAQLSKADLTTLMVYEFPELQGMIGHYYARQDGETAEVARAVEEHYRPRFAEDALPSGDVASLLALADKADAIAGCYAVGLLPKGNQDPYALRRAAIGIIRILEDRAYDLDFRILLDAAFETLVSQNIAVSVDARLAAHAFVQARAKVIYAERFPDDIVDAVLATGCGVPTEIVARLKALDAARADGWFDDAAAAFKRLQNISRKETVNDYEPELLREPAEQALSEAFRQSHAELEAALRARDFERALSVLARLKPFVDKFFDDVMVMSDDLALRRNRLGLLRALAADFFQISDFTLIRPEQAGTASAPKQRGK
jgi:glycyl-tRNA synthetase beta chain